MIRAIRIAYGAGFRGGMSPRPLILRDDGTKVLARPINPYKCDTIRGRILHHVYENGVHDGSMKSVRTWLAARKVGVA